MKKKILLIIVVIIIVAIGIYALSTTNNTTTNEDNVANISSSESSKPEGPQDITQAISNQENSEFYYGTIYKIEDQTIYFDTIDKGQYYFKDNDFNYINGRTFEQYTFENIQPNDYVHISEPDKIEIFRNITGEELKKELLVYCSTPMTPVAILSLDDDTDNPIQKINSNEATTIAYLHDAISSDMFPNKQDVTFEIKVKFTNDTTKYHSKSGKIVDIDTLIEYRKYNLSYIELDPKTINSECPTVASYDGTDT